VCESHFVPHSVGLFFEYSQLISLFIFFILTIYLKNSERPSGIQDAEGDMGGGTV
jgi:hypothetical protein